MFIIVIVFISLSTLEDWRFRLICNITFPVLALEYLSVRVLEGHVGTVLEALHNVLCKNVLLAYLLTYSYFTCMQHAAKHRLQNLQVLLLFEQKCLWCNQEM